MKRFSNLIVLVAFSGIVGCQTLPQKDFVGPKKDKRKPSDPNLTLIKKQVPKTYSFSFDRAELSFSTNKTQQTHAILTRYLCPEAIDVFQKAPLGQTMKKDEWDKYFMTDKICPATGRSHFNNWQKFYQ